MTGDMVSRRYCEAIRVAMLFSTPDSAGFSAWRTVSAENRRGGSISFIS
jgi:hypothetical protein